MSIEEKDYATCEFCDSEEEAIGRCIECGNPFCTDCRIYDEITDEYYCDHCLPQYDDGQRCPHDYPDARDE